MKHLTGINDLSDINISALLKRAELYAEHPEKGRDRLKGKIFINLFRFPMLIQCFIAIQVWMIQW